MQNKPPVTPLSRTYTNTHQHHPTVHTISYTLLQPRRSTYRPRHTQPPLLANHLLRLSKSYPPTWTLQHSQKSNKKSNIRFSGSSRLSTSTIQSRICRRGTQFFSSSPSPTLNDSSCIYKRGLPYHRSWKHFLRFTIILHDKNLSSIDHLSCVLDHIEIE